MVPTTIPSSQWISPTFWLALNLVINVSNSSTSADCSSPHGPHVQNRLGSALSPHNATFGYRAYCIHSKKGGGIEAVSAMEESELKKGVAEFYDESSWVVEGIWGDHLHHGIYFVDDPSHQEEQKAFASLPRAAQIRTIQATQIRTIDEALRFAAVLGFSLSLLRRHGAGKICDLSSLCTWLCFVVLEYKTFTLKQF